MRSIGALLVGAITLLGGGVATAMAWLVYECDENCVGPPARGGLRFAELSLAVAALMLVIAAIRHWGSTGQVDVKLVGGAAVAYGLWVLSVLVL
jgi:hypothetical protein